MINEFPKIVSDSGWSAVRFNSCITDFYRTIKFENKPTPEEFKKIQKWLETDNCPGWTGVQIAANPQNEEYKFTTTWDSSG